MAVPGIFKRGDMLFYDFRQRLQCRGFHIKKNILAKIGVGGGVGGGVRLVCPLNLPLSTQGKGYTVNSRSLGWGR